MKRIFLFAVMSLAASAMAAVTKKSVETQVHESNYIFDVYTPGSKNKKKLPGVVVAPEFWGKGPLEERMARRLADEGFVVLVLDLYGQGLHTKDATQAGEWTGKAEKQGFEKLYDIVEKGHQILKAQDEVNPSAIGLIGFGYGGGLAINMAKGGADYKAVVSFYGGLKKVRSPSSINVIPPILYVRPEKDAYTSDEEVQAFAAEMNKAKAPLSVEFFPKAQYGFIHENIESYGQGSNTFMYYDKESAANAWKKTLEFLRKNLK